MSNISSSLDRVCSSRYNVCELPPVSITVILSRLLSPGLSRADITAPALVLPADQFVRIYSVSYFWCFADCLICRNQPRRWRAGTHQHCTADLCPGLIILSLSGVGCHARCHTVMLSYYHIVMALRTLFALGWHCFGHAIRIEFDLCSASSKTTKCEMCTKVNFIGVLKDNSRGILTD